VTPCGLSTPFLDVQLGGTFAGDVNFTPTEQFAAGAIVDRRYSPRSGQLIFEGNHGQIATAKSCNS
jgi:hypothetical protein